jgi:protein O-GlcNAc transferase
MPRPGRPPRSPQSTPVLVSAPVVTLGAAPPASKGLFRLRNALASVLLLSGLCAFFVASHASAGSSAIGTPFSLRRATIRIDPNARVWARPGRPDGSAQAFRPLSTQVEDENGLHLNLVFDPTRLEKGAADAGAVSSTLEADAAKHETLKGIEDPGGCGHGGKCFAEAALPAVVTASVAEQHAHRDEHTEHILGHTSPAHGECWAHFDLGSIEAWDAASEMLCLPNEGWSPGVSDKVEIPGRIKPFYSAFVGASPRGALDIADGTLAKEVDGDALGGWLRCRVTSDSHLPPATAPHTLCDGANVVLDVAALAPTACLPSRSGYKCDGASIHWIFPADSLSARCTRTSHLMQEKFPRDHLRDMFSGWSGVKAINKDAAPASGTTVLVIARERGEHANLFHATSDWLNAYISLSIAGVIDSRTGARTHMGDVQLLLLDEQTGPFEDAIMQPIFSPKHPVLRVSELKKTGKPLLMRRALFVPPGYSSMLLSHVSQEGDCHAATQLLTGFRNFMLGGLGIDAALPPPLSSLKIVRVTLISRRPYSAAGIEHPFVGRQIDNEDAFLAALEAVSGLVVKRVDMAVLSAREQVRIIAEETDVLVGMHGAALTHVLYLPPWAAVLELWPKPLEIWRCFEHLATMSGLVYDRWANTANDAFRVDASGDYTRIDLADVVGRIKAMAEAILANRTALAAPHP